MVLEKTLESPLDCKEIQPVSPKANQSSIGKTDVQAQIPILWPPDAKNLGSITMNKASGDEGIPVELFKILKDDSVKVLHAICQQGNLEN